MNDTVSRILLDMDGVLVDFVWGVADALGKTHMIGEISKWDIYSQIGVTEAEFWAPCEHETFWEHLRWTREGPEIVTAALMAVGPENVYLLTSPCRSPRSLSGKAKWVAAHLPLLSRRLLVGACKHLCASPQHLLIDDADHNVAAFREGGGKAILVPRPWNENRGKPVLETVKQELKECFHGKPCCNG